MLPVSGWYSIALSAEVPDLVGRGRAIEVGGSARSMSAPGMEKRLVVDGKMGLPGRGIGVLLGWRGATLVRMTLLLRHRLARLDALLIPGMPEV